LSTNPETGFGRAEPRSRSQLTGAFSLLLTMAAFGGAPVTADARQWRVRDSIEMVRIADADLLGRSNAFEAPLKVSPDGKYVAFVLWSGNLASGMNEYSLAIGSIEDIRAFINSKRIALPRLEFVARFETNSTSRDGIEALRWVKGGSAIAFIGRKARGAGQVFLFDLKARSLRQLTYHPDDVVAFDVSESGTRLVYSANVPVDWTRRNQNGYAVASGPAYLLGKADPREIEESEKSFKYFVEDLATARVMAVTMEPNIGSAGEISIAPSGNFAVVARTVNSIPAHWGDYDFVRANPTKLNVHESAIRASSDTGFASERAEPIEFEDAFGQIDPLIVQYHLLDLRSGTISPLIDAPTRRLPNARVQPRWSSDDRAILIPPTYLPLGPNAVSRVDLGKRQAVAVVEVSGHQVSPIGESYDLYSTAGSIVGMDWNGGRSVTLLFADDVGRNASTARFNYVNDAWTAETRVRGQYCRATAQTNPPLDLRISQTSSSAPEVEGIDTSTSRHRVVTQLNPQLRSVRLGRVQEFGWQDRFGRDFSGSIVLPPKFKVGQRYPLVIQVDRYESPTFLVDGAYSGQTPYAAQALAARDIIVLDTPELLWNTKAGQEANGVFRRPERLWSTPDGNSGDAIGLDDGDNRETDLVLAGVDGAIDALDKAGLVDRSRVGLHGFSRHGMHVHYALTFGDYPIAAATIADSIDLSPYCYSALYGLPYPGMAEFEIDQFPGLPIKMAVGAQFWGQGIERWTQRSYLFHLNRIRTPIRYEQYGTQQVPCNWTPFAILKRHKRPVEMIHIPDATHVLKTPYARFTSQEGSVDWFDFWLNQREDPDPSKFAQYARWRKLLSARDAMSSPETETLQIERRSGY
jgi:hypothetical protein